MPLSTASLDWYVQKETHENWVPYHVGTTPSGQNCRSMPRVYVVRPGVYRCPACGKEFPTFTEQKRLLDASATETPT